MWGAGVDRAVTIIRSMTNLFMSDCMALSVPTEKVISKRENRKLIQTTFYNIRYDIATSTGQRSVVIMSALAFVENKIHSNYFCSMIL